MAEGLWAGLVTNASPYAIPPGAAVEQTNLVTTVPGQLATRGGMWPAASTPTATAVRDVYPRVTSTATQMVALNASGELVLLSSISYGTAPAAPLSPTLAPSAGQVQSNYLGDFYDHAGEPP
jgi:hypothetical protein